jgi:predicted dehydrogenase
MENNRRSFLKKSAIAGLGASVLAIGKNNAANEFGAIPVSANRSEKLKTKKDPSKIYMGFIGVGLRGEEHIRNAMSMDGIEITAICDIDNERIRIIQELIISNGRKPAETYSDGDYAFKKMLDRGDLDAVIIATPWEWHAPMSVASMKAGAYTGVEVSAANTLEECWDLVNTHEQTGSHLMILENVCYRRDIMAVLNMVRTGLYGELLHARCGYQHDLRQVKFNNGKGPYGGGVEFGEKANSEARWRTQHSVRRNGDLYPTHGVGPVSTFLNINNGNRFLTISSLATKTRGLHKYIVDTAGPDHPNAKVIFNLGDIVTSMIHCANGETILVTHDTNNPRPYSLGFRVQGTKGLWNNEGNTIYVEGKSGAPHEWDNSEPWLNKYDHKLWRELEHKAEGAGHGGMDYMLMYDFIEAVRNKRPTPLDAYDAAAWSAISNLSEMSVSKGGIPVDFPDFTRGQWIKRKSAFASDPKFPASE